MRAVQSGVDQREMKRENRRLTVARFFFFFFFFFFFTPFVLQSRRLWFCEAFLNLLCFSIQVCHARCFCSG